MSAAEPLTLATPLEMPVSIFAAYVLAALMIGVALGAFATMRR